MSWLRSSSTGLVRLVLLAGLWIRPTAAEQDTQAIPNPESESVDIAKRDAFPKLIHRIDAQYTPEARAAGVQGAVVFEMVVNEQGVPVNIELMSALGFGLDEAAFHSVEQWRFEPASKDGHPIRVLAHAKVNFHLIDRFEIGNEERRAKFNVAVQGLASPPGAQREESIKLILDLAEAKYPPAMYVLANLLRNGDGIERDLRRAKQLIQESANRKYAPSLFVIGFSKLQGATQPDAKAAALRLIYDASLRGDYYAQLFIGDTSEKGTHGPPDLERATHAFRLCAATGHSDCQYRVGKLLFEQTPKKDPTLIQAVAWLQLAADHGQTDAAALARQAAASLTAEQAVRVRRLKPQLQQKP